MVFKGGFMKLVKATHPYQLKNIERLYQEAFPPEEQKPFQVMLQKSQEGHVEMLSVEDDNRRFLGLVISVLYRDTVLLDYFAISPERREGGIGSAVFRMLKKRYADKRFFLEIESTRVNAANMEQRLRRKSFYLKNGMTFMPFIVNTFGVELEIMTNSNSLSFDDYHTMYHEIFGSRVSRHIKLKQ